MLHRAEADGTKLLCRTGPIRASYSREVVQAPLSVGCADELGLLHYAGGDTYACRYTRGGGPGGKVAVGQANWNWRAEIAKGMWEMAG